MANETVFGDKDRNLEWPIFADYISAKLARVCAICVSLTRHCSMLEDESFSLVDGRDVLHSQTYKRYIIIHGTRVPKGFHLISLSGKLHKGSMSQKPFLQKK